MTFRQKVREQDKREAKRLLKKFKSLKLVAQRMGVSKATVWNWVNG